MGSRDGILKVAAKRIGVDLKVYLRNISKGLKWCITCKAWHPRNDFSEDMSRGDGLYPSCKKSKNRNFRAKYVPKKRPPKGRSFVPARDGDKHQARRRINHFVESGIIPEPNSIPCVDCGHIHGTDSKRHEYDHHLGYAAKHHEDVEAVCTTCHKVREERRKKNGYEN